MPTPIGNNWIAAASAQETPDAFWRLDDSQAYDQVVLGDGPVLYLRLGDAAGSTTPVDSSPNGLTATASAVTFGQIGPFSDSVTAGLFNGTSSKVTEADNAALHLGDVFTIECWIKRSSVGLGQQVILFDGNVNSISFQIDTDDKIRIVRNAVAALGKSTAKISDTTTWHHLAFTKSGATMHIYIDAVDVTGSMINSTISNSNGITIGYAVGNTNFFPGMMARVAYYGTALSATQIAAHYAVRTTTIPTTILADLTTNNSSATVSGAVVTGQAGWPGDGDSAALFNGSTGYANAGNLAALAYTTRFSVVAAFKTSGNGAVMYVVSKALSAGPNGWALAVDATGKPRFYGYTSGGVSVFDITSSAAYQDNAWHLAVGIYDPLDTNLASLYVDNVLKASATPGAGTIDINNARLLLGAIDNAGIATGFFNGSLDEIGVYPYAFTATQVAALYNARNTTMSAKALTQARAAVLRSGAGRSSYFTARPICQLNGVDLLAATNTQFGIEKGSLKVTEILSTQPNTARFTVWDKSGTMVPSPGMSVLMADGATNNAYFGGVVTRMHALSVRVPAGAKATVQRYVVDVTDYSWLLSTASVTKQYASGQSGTAVVLDLIQNFAPSGFTTHNVQTSAPTLTAPITFRGLALTAALAQVCQSTSPNWYFKVDANKDIHYFRVEKSQNPTPLTPGVYTYDKLAFDLDFTQIRTRMLVEGGGSFTTAGVSAGSTSIPVQDCSWYSGTGGSIITPEGDIVTYTGVSAASGAGNLTGVPASGAGSIVHAILSGETLNVWVQLDDTAAQTTLAGLVGGGFSGVAAQYLSVSNGTIAQCTQYGNAELSTYKNTIVAGTVWSTDLQMREGKTLVIRIPARNISFQAVIQKSERSLLNPSRYQFDATFGVVFRNLVDVLKRAGAVQ